VVGIVAQALFNISVALSLVPTKGIPLPFISYGGSSMLLTLVGAGVLLNISQQGSAQGAAVGGWMRRQKEIGATPASSARRRAGVAPQSWRPEGWS
jgi:hypothetical protein